MAFLASDGTAFSSEKDCRRYEFEAFLTFRDEQGTDNEHCLLMKEQGSISGRPFEMYNLRYCDVLLLDHCEAVQVDDVQNCRVLIGACCDTVSVRDCVNCSITVGCKKLRARNCKNCTFHLCCSSESIIDQCQNISVAPFNAAYDGLNEQFIAAGLDPGANVWFEVQESSVDGSRNWKILDNQNEDALWLPLGDCEDLIKFDREMSGLSGLAQSIKDLENNDTNKLQFNSQAQQKEEIIKSETEEALKDRNLIRFAFTSESGRFSSIEDIVSMLNEATSGSWVNPELLEDGRLLLECSINDKDSVDSLWCSIMWALSSHEKGGSIKWVDKIEDIQQELEPSIKSEPKATESAPISIIEPAKLASLAARGHTNFPPPPPPAQSQPVLLGEYGQQRLSMSPIRSSIKSPPAASSISKEVDEKEGTSTPPPSPKEAQEKEGSSTPPPSPKEAQENEITSTPPPSPKEAQEKEGTSTPPPSPKEAQEKEGTSTPPPSPRETDEKVKQVEPVRTDFTNLKSNTTLLDSNPSIGDGEFKEETSPQSSHYSSSHSEFESGIFTVSPNSSAHSHPGSAVLDESAENEMYGFECGSNESVKESIQMSKQSHEDEGRTKPRPPPTNPNNLIVNRMEVAGTVVKVAHTLKAGKHVLTRELLRDTFRVFRRNDIDEFWGFLLRMSQFKGGTNFEDDRITFQELQQALRDYQNPSCLVAEPPLQEWSNCERLCCELNERIHRMYGYRRNDLFTVFKRFASPDGATSVSISQGVFRDACLSELRMRTKTTSVHALFKVLGETEEADNEGVSLYDISCVLKQKFDIDSNKRQIILMAKKNAEMNETRQQRLKKKRKSKKSVMVRSLMNKEDLSLLDSDSSSEEEEELSLVDQLLLDTGSKLAREGNQGATASETLGSKQSMAAAVNKGQLTSKERQRQEVVVQQEVNIEGIYKNLNLSIEENNTLLQDMFQRSLTRLS